MLNHVVEQLAILVVPESVLNGPFYIQFSMLLVTLIFMVIDPMPWLFEGMHSAADWSQLVGTSVAIHLFMSCKVIGSLCAYKIVI